MKFYYCPECDTIVEASRDIDLLTMMLTIATCGFYAIFILFYPKRCKICNRKVVEYEIYK